MICEGVKGRREQERTAFRVHCSAYLTVTAILATVNLISVPEFLWFIFPLPGWGVGVTVHYVFGVRPLEQVIVRNGKSTTATHNEPVRRYS